MDALEPAPPGAGLCGHCQHVRVVRSDRGSLFYQCRLSVAKPEFPKYPRLPVLTCSGFEERLVPPQGQ